MLPSRYLLTSYNRLDVDLTLMMLLLAYWGNKVFAPSTHGVIQLKQAAAVASSSVGREWKHLLHLASARWRPHGAFESVKAHTRTLSR